MLRGARSMGCLVLLSAVTALAAATLSGDRLVDLGFGKALSRSHATLSFDGVGGKHSETAATAGDEGFWLSQAEVKSPAPFAKPLSVGDRITIAGSDGRERRLEVVDLKAVGDNGSRAAAGHGRLLLVSCRVKGKAEEPAEATVRFLIEAESPPQPARPNAL